MPQGHIPLIQLRSLNRFACLEYAVQSSVQFDDFYRFNWYAFYSFYRCESIWTPKTYNTYSIHFCIVDDNTDIINNFISMCENHWRVLGKFRYNLFQCSHSWNLHVSIKIIAQGFILGPLFFLIYVKDSSSVSETCFSILFADDTKMFITWCNVKELCN